MNVATCETCSCIYYIHYISLFSWGFFFLVLFFAPLNSMISLVFFCFELILNSRNNGHVFYCVYCVIIQSWVGAHVLVVWSSRDCGCMIITLIIFGFTISNLLICGILIIYYPWMFIYCFYTRIEFSHWAWKCHIIEIFNFNFVSLNIASWTSLFMQQNSFFQVVAWKMNGMSGWILNFLYHVIIPIIGLPLHCTPFWLIA